MMCARLPAVLLIIFLAGVEPRRAVAAEPSSSTSGVVASMPAAVNSAAYEMPTVSTFGRLPDGREAHLYTLAVPGGWRATITDFGAILTSMHVPGNDGKPVDVVLGFDALAGYAAKHPYFGATCGRVANRIAAGRFELDGKPYQLATNNEPNHLHGGLVGFDKKLWRATPRISAKGPAVDFELVSPAGDEGYPGQLTAKATYTLTPDGELWEEMTATCDAPTIVNLVHHSYWNLAGQASGTIHGHELSVAADRYLPVDAGGIPTGEFAPVAGTPFDLRPERLPAGTLGDAIRGLPPSADGKNPGGIDHNYVVRGWKPDGSLRSVAVLRDPASRRSMEILSDQPGIQVYTGNYLDGSVVGKGGTAYAKQAAVCLETQKYPDAVHHAADRDWPPVRLDPGQTYRHTMVHRFSPGR
ncbi:MAG: Aldose 1-epimerase [Planctomycetota bacterium]|jgi:aldose 1-epimerase